MRRIHVHLSKPAFGAVAIIPTRISSFRLCEPQVILSLKRIRLSDPAIRGVRGRVRSGRRGRSRCDPNASAVPACGGSRRTRLARTVLATSLPPIAVRRWWGRNGLARRFAAVRRNIGSRRRHFGMRGCHFGRLARSVMILVRIARFVRRRDLRVVVRDFDFLRSSGVAIAVAIRLSHPLRTAGRICMCCRARA